MTPLSVHTHGLVSTYVLVYVDDITITGASVDFIQHLITKLNSEFALKDLGNVHYFLGFEVHRLHDVSLFLSQQKYIRDLLVKYKMDKAKALQWFQL